MRVANPNMTANVSVTANTKLTAYEGTVDAPDTDPVTLSFDSTSRFVMVANDGPGELFVSFDDGTSYCTVYAGERFGFGLAVSSVLMYGSTSYRVWVM